MHITNSAVFPKSAVWKIKYCYSFDVRSHKYFDVNSQGYQTPLLENMDSLGVSDEDILALFNNIEEIKDFNEYVGICVFKIVCCVASFKYMLLRSYFMY